jgi:hypothetical protein
LKKTLVFILTAAALISGCADRKGGQPPDDPLGRTLLIYDSGENSIASLLSNNSNQARFRRLAKTVAQAAYAEVFDLRQDSPPPDAQKYDTFLVAAKASGGNETLESFLGGFDFWDATVIPFWMSEIGDRWPETGITARGAWLLLDGRDFRYYKGIKQRDIDTLAVEWLLGLRAELAARRAVGEGAGELVKAFAAAFPDRITGPEFRFSTVDGRADWYFNLDGSPYAYASGRFLPVDEVSHSEDFRPLSVYRYRRQADDPETEDRWNELASKLRSRRNGGAFSGRNRGAFNPDAARSPFYETLYGCRTREEAYRQQIWIDFLGRKVQVHKAIHRSSCKC